MLTEEIAWQDRCHAAEGERDNARKWAKAWKFQATRFRGRWQIAEGERDAEAKDRARIQRQADYWHAEYELRHEQRESCRAQIGMLADEVARLTAERDVLRAQLSNHVEADTRAAEASLHVSQRQVRLERVVSAARRVANWWQGGETQRQREDGLLAALADLDAWEESRRQEAGG